MEKVINGKRYNTESTPVLCAWDNGEPPGDSDYEAEILHIKQTMELFIHVFEGEKEYLKPVSPAVARDWVKSRFPAERTDDILKTIADCALKPNRNEGFYKARKAVGLTQTALAEKLGVDMRRIQKIELNAVEISRIEFGFGLALAKALKIKPDKLLNLK